MDNTSNTTTVTAAALGGALGIVAVWIIGLLNVDVGAEVGGAFAVIGTALVGLIYKP